jgi:anti-sigma factor RsiW
MNQHLSEKEFAVAIVKGLTPQQHQHVGECSRCAAEMESFSRTVSSFRSSFRELIDAELARGLHPSVLTPQPARRPIGLWGLAAAMIAMVVAVPAFFDNVVPSRVAGESPADTNPDALMKSIQAHLSRTVPGPMEPMLIFVRNRELDTEQRGVQ